MESGCRDGDVAKTPPDVDVLDRVRRAKTATNVLNPSLMRGGVVDEATVASAVGHMDRHGGSFQPMFHPKFAGVVITSGSQGGDGDTKDAGG